MFRVALIGSHSTGKSTLARALDEALRARGERSALAMEPIRALQARLSGVDANSRHLLLLAEHFRRLHPPSADILVLDRTLLDLRVYLRREATQAQAVLEVVDALLPDYLALIPLVVLLPVEFPLVPDERRPTSETYRAQIETDLRALAATHDLELTEARGSVDERLTQVIAAIDRVNRPSERRAGS